MKENVLQRESVQEIILYCILLFSLLKSHIQNKSLQTKWNFKKERCNLRSGGLTEPEYQLSIHVEIWSNPN